MERAINGANVTTEEKIKEEILEMLSQTEDAISTNDICLKLERSWHSIQTNCLRLQIEGKLHGFRAGRLNLWQSIRHAKK